MEEQSIFSFPATVYQELEPYNQVISKARVRIFYKGLNRNRTYITDEFAEKLLSTLSYSPVCGIYDDNEQDYTTHGVTRDLAKAYGVIPQEHNFRWEKHLDKDGIEREYACADVLLWTARYKEAKEIVGKGQSMELYSNLIRGAWEDMDGVKVFKFTDGCFIGLSPLGDNVEPCFEGAAFYSLNTSLQEMVKELQNYNLAMDNKGGREDMKINFKLSDAEKANALFLLLNPEFSEENDYKISFGLIDVYDEYAFCYSYEDGNYYRVYYNKDDEKNEIVLGNKEIRYCLDISEAELKALTVLRQLSGNDSFEKIDEIFLEKDESIASKERSISERDETIATLTQQNSEYAEKDARYEEVLQEHEERFLALQQSISEKEENFSALSTKNLELEQTNVTLKQENDALSTYKLNKEREEKKAVIAKFSVKLDKEVLEEYENNIDSYTFEELNKELAVKLLDATPSLFSTEESIVISTGSYNKMALSPAGELLNKHRKMANRN